MQIKVVFILLLISHSLFGQYNFFNTNDSLINDYHKLLYEYEFENAHKTLKKISALNSKKETYLFDVNYDWWQIISGEDSKDNFKRCFAVLNEAQIVLANEAIETEYDLLNALLIYLYEARIHVFNKNYYKALVGYSQMLSMFKKLMNDDNNPMSDNKKLVLGFYNYSVGRLKSKYPIFYPYFLLLPSSDIELGKKWIIQSLKSKSVVVHTEALYFLMKISLELDNDYEYALLFSNQLIKEYPKNLLFLFYHFQIHYALKNFEEAKQISQKIYTIAHSLSFLSEKQKTHFNTIIEKDYLIDNE